MVFFVLITIFVVTLIPYVLIAIIVALFGDRIALKRDYSYHPSVSVVVPTFNEERNIARKLENLLKQTYPISEILVIDCSGDATRKIVKEFQKKYTNIRLIEQTQRMGMPETLNMAYSIASGDLVIKTDCDSVTLSNDSIRDLVAVMSDERIGGVSGVCVGGGVEGYFRKFLTRLQIAESNLDSTIIAHASSLLCLRKKDMHKLSFDSVNDDAEEFVAIRKKGYRTIIDPTIKSIEDVPKQFLQRRIQKDRRAEGTIRVLFRNLSIFLNPRYGLYGLIVFPMDLFLLAISPFIIITDLFLLAYLSILISPMLLLPFSLLILLSILFYKSNKLSWFSALIDFQICGLFGTIRALTLKSNALWKRARN